MVVSQSAMGAVIRKYRKEQRLTQNNLAEKIGMTSRQIMDIENGKSNPKFDTLCSLIQELHIPADQIFHAKMDSQDAVMEQFILKLRDCSERERGLVIATATALIHELKA